ncbi:MAG TPA: cytochrome P450 [Steroidobacteraceae bacterium]|jgi:cytochrome P450|nr:cytochrome P450 [Steroidobacteraceae bacterium]
MSTVLARPPTFNPFARDFVRDPYPVYHAMQREDPYHRVRDTVVLTRFADVKQALASPQLSSAAIPDLVHAFQQRVGSTDLHRLYELGRKAIVFTDRPEHARLRRLVGRCFSRDRLARWEPMLARVAHARVTRFPASGGDFVGAVAGAFCMDALLELLGLPAADAERIDGWTTNLRWLLEPGFLTPQRLLKTYRQLEDCFAYMREAVAARQREPRDDLISDLLRPDAADGLQADEVAYACIMVFVAGKETTKALMGNALHVLATQPQEQAWLREDPLRVPAFIHESLRFDAPLQQTKRVCREPCTLGEESFEAGTSVLLCLGAANRDPAEFADPDRFDPRRPPGANLALGHGMHHCLGMQLSRLMAQHLFDVLLANWRTVELLDADPPRIQSSFILRGFQSLRLRVTRA